jgi:predicted NBD/HSP70 family sugar kinase
LSKGSEILRPKAVRGANSAAILQLLRQYGSLSRADVARQSGLSEGSVSRITSELIRREIVCEDGAENSTGGRPGTRLRLHDRHVGVGVEIRRGEARIAAATLSGKILESTTVVIPSPANDALKAVAEAVRVFKERYRKNYIEGVGVSIHGIVNSRTGVVELGNLPGWVRIPAREYLHQAIGLPVRVDNNVRLAAIAEYNYGNLLEVRNSRCLLFTMVDEGIGIGIVLDGKLYYGPQDAAGEFGQMVIADGSDSSRLDCSGCLENLASSTALCDRYASLTQSRSVFRTSDNRARVRKICQLALAGDAVALEALSVTSRYLGIGLVNVIWGLNADAVVVDAAMNEAWPVVSRLILDQFPKSDEIVTFRRVVLRPSSLAGEATMVGAATLPFQDLFASGVTQTADTRRPRSGSAKK